jgi:hypothetical protein
MRSHGIVTPRHRPPLGLRLVPAVLAVAALLFNAAVMLSDRAPSSLRGIGGDLVRRLSDRIDAGGRPSRIAADPRLPESDTLVHIGLWGTAMILVGLTLWTWRGLAVAAVVVFATSVLIEIAQARVTDTRVSQWEDVVANAVGIGLGTVVVAACYLAWSAGAKLFGGSR